MWKFELKMYIHNTLYKHITFEVIVILYILILYLHITCIMYIGSVIIADCGSTLSQKYVFKPRKTAKTSHIYSFSFPEEFEIYQLKLGLIFFKLGPIIPCL